MIFEIERENVTLVIDAHVTKEDIGIGSYECHGMRGYDSRIISFVEAGDVLSLEVVSMINDKSYQIDFHKLKDANQEMIIEQINKEL